MRKQTVENIWRGDIYYADLGKVVGSEQGGIRPVLIISNNTGNQFGPTVMVAPITSRSKSPLPTHVKLKAYQGNLSCDSTVLLEQERTLDKSRLQYKVGHLRDCEMMPVNEAIMVSHGIYQNEVRHNERCKVEPGAR